MGKGSNSTSEGRAIAVLVHSLDVSSEDTAYYKPMLDGVLNEARSRGFTARLIPALRPDEKEKFLTGPRDQYYGIVVTGALYDEEDFIRKVVETYEGAKVMLDHHFDDVPMHSVQEDATGGMRDLTAYLLSLGHREIGYVGKRDPYANPWKRLGISAALSEEGLLLDEKHIVGGGWSEKDVRRALDMFLKLDPRPTAVICSDDHRALRLRNAAEGNGLHVPGDLSIAGFGDAAARIGKDDNLTSVQFGHIQMGRKAAELACGDPHAEPTRVMLPCRLVVRGSTGKPPGGA